MDEGLRSRCASLILNLIIQAILSFAFMGAINFFAAGTIDYVRHPPHLGALFYVAGTSLVLGSWWGVATIPCSLFCSSRIGIQEQTLQSASTATPPSPSAGS